jgi:hypothetical protein
MQCFKCKGDLDEHGHCPQCDPVEKVQVMSDEEIEEYRGLTIEDKESAQRNESFRYQHERSGQNPYERVYIRQFGLQPLSWRAKITMGLVVLGIVAAGVFALSLLLPLIIIGVAVGAVIWTLLRFLR